MGNIGKIISVLGDIWNEYEHKTLLTLVLVIILVGFRKKPHLFRYMLFSLPVVPVFSRFTGLLSSSGYILYFSLLAPYLFLLIGNKKFARQLFYGIWIPSFIAGMTTAWTSSNSHINASVGLFPGSIVTLVFLVVLFSGIEFPKGSAHFSNMKLQIVLPTLVLFMLLNFQYSILYRDDNIQDLKTKVESGPFRGLYTSKEKNDYLTVLCDDIKAVSRPGDKILFYDRFPAGYLLTSMLPATNTVWLQPISYFPNLKRQDVINYYQKNNIEPDLVVRMKKVFYSKMSTDYLSYPSQDSLNSMIESNRYQAIVLREDYTIYRKAIGSSTRVEISGSTAIVERKKPMIGSP
ncbi:MAG: hypothetical protein AB1393_03585 [Candidatus Edwardsbacteria bacterium]